MDSSTAEESLSQEAGLSKWRDKQFTNMYSRDQYLSSSRVVSKQPKIVTKKTLYEFSQERILDGTVGRVCPLEGGTSDRELATHYDSTTDDSDTPSTNTHTSKLRSVVTVVQHDICHSNEGLKKSGRYFVSEESGHSSTDSGVSKRCIDERQQEAELVERKLKKKHKRHVSFRRSSRKIESESSVESSKEMCREGSTTKKYKKKKKSKSCNQFASQVKKSDVENVASQQHIKTSISSETANEIQSDVIPLKEIRNKPTVASQIIEVAQQYPHVKHTDERDEVPCLNATKNLPGFGRHLSNDENANNNNNSETNHRERLDKDKKPTKKYVRKGITYQRTSSTSSISSTSTSTSVSSLAASASSSIESLAFKESKSHEKTKTSSKKKVVSYKTAKHLHKSKGSIDGGDNAGSMDREGKLVTACSLASKNICNSEKKKCQEKKVENKSRKTPNSVVLLSHIQKAFASSCTESDMDRSPVQNTLVEPHINSLTSKINNYTENLTNSNAGKDLEEGHNKLSAVKTNLSSHIMISACLAEPVSEWHVYSKPAVVKVCEMKVDDLHPKKAANIIKDQCFQVPEQNQIDLYNTTYQLSTKPTLKQTLTCHLDSFKKIDSKNGTESEIISKTDSVASGSRIPEYKLQTPAKEEYDLEPGELVSEDSDDESWNQMVKEITKENNNAQWNYVIDSQRRRLCVEGTTYAGPPVQWRTNWHCHSSTSAPHPPKAVMHHHHPPYPPSPPLHPPSPPLHPPSPLLHPPSPSLHSPSPSLHPSSPSLHPPSIHPPSLHLPSPPLHLPSPQHHSSLPQHHSPSPPLLAPPSNSLYHQASQKMFSAAAVSPFLWQSTWRVSPVSWRPDVCSESREDTNWRTKRLAQDNDSYCSHDESHDIPVPSATLRNEQLSSYHRFVPPRLMKKEQQKNYAFNNSSYAVSTFYPQNEQQINEHDSSSKINVWENFSSNSASTSPAITPQKSWPTSRKSFSPATSPVTPFDYDTSSIVYPYSMKEYVDTHCHIDFLYQRLNFKGTFHKFTLQHHFPPNYAGCVAVFCTPQSMVPNGIWNDLLKEDNIWGAFGIHPHHVKFYDGHIEDNIQRCMKHHKAIAFGEIGLDYSNRNSSDWILQQEVFRRQLNMALKMEKPLVIHSRDAEDDTISIMASLVPSDYPIHRHCFTGTPEEARRWFSVFPKSFIGLTALVTFPTATGSHRTATEIPLERLLLETDSPYFLPRQCPRNLKYANPSMAVFVAERIARLRGITTDQVLVAVRKNTQLMYGV